MKLLIVDDEYHVIKTVKYLIRMSSLDISEIFEANSAKDAITIIERERPQIMITDVVMTDVTGLELMNYLNHSTVPIKVIVISGYNNFEYIRAALRAGGVDYLLKPIDADQLAAAVQKAIDEWRLEDARTRQTEQHLEMISSMSALCKETLLYRIMTQPTPEKYYQDLIQIVPMLRQCRNCIIGYLNCQPFTPGPASEIYNRITSAVNQLKETLQQKNIGSCFFSADDSREVILFIHHHTSDSLRFIENEIEQVRAHYGIPMSFGLSRPLAFPGLTADAFQQAQRAFYGQSIFSPAPPLLSYSRIRQDDFQPQHSDLEQQLFSALITGNENLFDESISQWINTLFTGPDISLCHALSAIQRFNSLMDDWKMELKNQYPNLVISDCQPLYYHQFLDQKNLFSTEMLKKNMKIEMFQLSGELTSPSSHPHNDVIYQIAHYIRLNYNKPFSQFACAQLFFINKNYMCRKFKNTFHINMISYLNQIRIDHAKELLENPGIKIKDVANLVGFEDEKYFSRQFHKTTGMSPNEYRSQMNKEDNFN